MRISQNRKIAIAATAIFAVSFAVMMLFLKNGIEGIGADVLGAGGGHQAETVAEYSAEISFVTDSQAKVIYAEEGFCSSVGAPCSTLVGKSIFDFVNADDAADMIAKFTNVIGDKEGFVTAGPYRIGIKTYERLVLLDATPAVEKGKVSEVKFVVRDLTNKIENLQNEDGDWTNNLYPKIKEMKDEDGRLMVDKISFKQKE